MGTMTRLLGVVANNDGLEIYPIPYTGVPGAKFATETRISQLLSRDISGNRVPVTVQGAPEFTGNSVRGGGGAPAAYKWLRAAYAPAAGASRTMCVVARYVQNASGSAFAISDNNGQAGCSLFIEQAGGWRAQVLVAAGLNAAAGIFPAPLPNLPAMDKTAWHFAALVIDADGRQAKFMLPAYGYSASAVWSADKKISPGAGELRIGGASSAGADSCDVAFATYHDRPLSDREVLQQYYAAKNYCDAVGVAVV